MTYEDQLLRSVNLRLFRFGVAACVVIVALAHGHIVGYATVFEGTQELPPEVIQDQLRRFIYDVRSIANNTEFEQRNVHAAYAMARGQAVRVIEDYYRRNPDKDPMK